MNLKEILTANSVSIKTNGDVNIEVNNIHTKNIKGYIKTVSLNGIEIRITDIKIKNKILISEEIDGKKIQLNFVLKGNKKLKIKCEINCKEGMYYVLKKGSKNKITNTINCQTFKEVRFNIPEERIKNSLLEVKDLNSNLLDTYSVMPINHDMLTIIKEIEKSNLDELSFEKKVNFNILKLITIHIETCIKKVNSTSNTTNTMMKKLNTIQYLILKNINKNFTINYLSKKVGTNTTTLTKEFKNNFNCTISQFSKQEKMKHAKNLLINSDLTIYEVADKVGYKNATHFTAAFKKHLGITPKKLRLTNKAI